ncbi:hypothetical protein IMSAGC007_03000 [Lachnospiraceae bacterium]|nr:hypothetical protein IMSAGC007_03000 [Lachnospiraceae bacterium]
MQDKACKRMAAEGRKEGKAEGRKEGIEQGIKAFIEICQENAMLREAAFSKLMEKFSLTSDLTKEYLERFWKTQS